MTRGHHGWLLVVLGLLAAGPALADPSPTCEQPGPTAGELDHVTIGGVQRPLILALAGGGDRNVPRDLVVAFHGRTNANTDVRGYFDLEANARRPTVVVYPSALPVATSPRAWADPGDPAEALRDYALFDAIVTEVGRRYCLDRTRVFAVGHSLGASFANSLACARGRTLRAVATVAGGIEAGRCGGEVSALLVHHPDDRLVPIELGEQARDVILAQNGLARSAPERGALGGFDCRRWGDVDGPIVLWCLHDESLSRSGRYYPHRWPGAAGATIMRFFANLP